MVSTRSPGPKASKEAKESNLPKGRITNAAAVNLSGIFLYVVSPFFAHPLKIIANACCGAPYEDAYAHFRRDHANTLNLIFHCFILCLQVTFNFAFLAKVDDDFNIQVGGVGMATASVTMWTALLAFTPSPLLVKVVALSTVFAGYYVRSTVMGLAFSHLMHFQVNTTRFPLGLSSSFLTSHFRSSQPFFDSLVYIYFLKKPVTLNLYTLVFGIRITLHYIVITYAKGILVESLNGDNGVALSLGFLALVALLSHKPFTKPASGVFGLGVILGWLLAAMTLKPILFLWAGGFIATALQGVSHRETKEPPTMPHLANISNELAHSTFFPCLLLQACLEQVKGVNSTKDDKKKKK